MIDAIERRLIRIEGRLNLLQWQVGLLALVMAGGGGGSIWLLLRVAAKVGALG
jgi:hypothetical protein